MDISPKERRFISEYLKDQNATAAAKRAGYSAKTAKQQGSRLLSKVYLRDEIDAALKRINAKCELTAELVREKVFALLTFDPRRAFNPDGTMKDPCQMPDDVIVALGGIEVNDELGEVKKIKFTDRIRAAELAAKILGMVQLAITGKDGKPLSPTVMQIDFSRIDDDALRAIAGMRVNGNGSKT